MRAYFYKHAFFMPQSLFICFLKFKCRTDGRYICNKFSREADVKYVTINISKLTQNL